MKSIMLKAQSLRSLTNERGVTAIEYGLIAALIAVTVIAGVTLVGKDLLSVFNGIASSLAAALPAPA